MPNLIKKMMFRPVRNARIGSPQSCNIHDANFTGQLELATGSSFLAKTSNDGVKSENSGLSVPLDFLRCHRPIAGIGELSREPTRQRRCCIIEYYELGNVM